MLVESIWTLAALAASIYCASRAFIDLRARKYVWGLSGLASALVFLLTPLPTHAVKFDLPRSGR